MILSPLTLAAILAAAVAMVIFGYMSKSHERNAKAKTRRIARLKERTRKLDNIIVGLPAAYLPKTLKVLIYASIVDSLRQVQSLSGNDSISKQIERVKQTLSTIVDLEPQTTSEPERHDSMLELKECKYLLKDLYSLIMEFHSEGSLNKKTADAQLKLVRSLMLKVMLDTYKAAANAAISDNNKGLALHYSSMALNRLNQAPSLEGLEKDKLYFSEQVTSLEAQMQSAQASLAASNANNAPEEAVLAQWQALEEADDDWKKKRY